MKIEKTKTYVHKENMKMQHSINIWKPNCKIWSSRAITVICVRTVNFAAHVKW